MPLTDPDRCFCGATDNASVVQAVASLAADPGGLACYIADDDPTIELDFPRTAVEPGRPRGRPAGR